MLFERENYQLKSNSLGFYQDLEHLDGVGISAVSANLYENKKRDDLVIFYFRNLTGKKAKIKIATTLYILNNRRLTTTNKKIKKQKHNNNKTQ